MFNLVESRPEDRRKRIGISVFFTGIALLFIGGAMLWTMFSLDLLVAAASGDDFSLVAPVAPAVNEPPPAPKPQEQTRAPRAMQQAPPNPDQVQQPRAAAPKGAPVDIPEEGSDASTDTVIGGDTSGTGDAEQGDKNVAGTTDGDPQATAPYVPPPPTPAPTPVPTPVPTPQPTPVPPPAIIRRSEVLNGSAISLPKPPYPPSARAVGASGAVRVEVVIDERGNVISATATSGHMLLKQVSVQAARQARFSPTIVSGKATKVSGTIVYNFAQ